MFLRVLLSTFITSQMMYTTPYSENDETTPRGMKPDTSPKNVYVGTVSSSTTIVYQSLYVNLNLSTDDIADYLFNETKIHLITQQGHLSFHYKPNVTMSGEESKNERLMSTGCLSIQMTVPMTMIMSMQVTDINIEYQSTCLSVFDSPDWPPVINKCGTNKNLPVSKNSSTNNVIIKIQSELSGAFRFQMKLRGVVPSPERRLKLIYTSSTQGYIQTPYWDRHNNYRQMIDSWMRVAVPRRHSVLISVDYKVLNEFDALALYKGDNSKHDVVWITDGHYNITPVLLNTSTFFVHFQCGQFSEYAGFSLRFSFHNSSLLPEQRPDGRWNCSVPNWADFKQHLSCDLTVECENGEDEWNCPYGSDKCGPGYFLAGGSCFMFVVTYRAVSWMTASEICRQRGNRLATLNTWEKITEAFQVLRKYMLVQYLKVRIYIGLRTSNPGIAVMYQTTFQWLDGSVAYFINIRTFLMFSYVALSAKGSGIQFIADTGTELHQANVLCENVTTLHSPTTSNASTLIDFTTLSAQQRLNANFVVCQLGHVMQRYLACDVKNACWEEEYHMCKSPLTSPPPSFTCFDSKERVPYTLVCDYRSDCNDNSDERFCVFPSCSEMLQCANSQCFTIKELCDGRQHCVDGVDEDDCDFMWITYESLPKVTITCVPPPATQFFYNHHRSAMIHNSIPSSGSNVTLSCPETHFLCPNTGYCLHVFVICNGVYDCPGHEDERGCEGYTCPGFYRCRASKVCVHLSHLCDNVDHCPKQDDEQFCNLTCPENCTCHGLAFVCTRPFLASEYPDLRYVDAHNTGMTPIDFGHNTYLIYLNLQNCGLRELNYLVLNNLLSLDLSDNKLSVITSDALQGFRNLRELSLAGNPLVGMFPAKSSRSLSFPNVYSLNLSRIVMQELDTSLLAIFPNLQTMTLLGCGIEKILGEGFKPLKHLHRLDIRLCPLKMFPGDLFQGLSQLEAIYADNFKICCRTTLPESFVPSNCQAPSDEISSCEDLLLSDVYRVCLAMFCVLALLGNVSSFVYRVFINTVTSEHGYTVFVTHLCMSDFLMGVYLAMIGVADWSFRGNYVLEDVTWRKSNACKLAGFLSLLSNEVSAFIICFITLDRFLVLRFPLSRFHFRKRSAQVACTLVWLVGIVLAALPLLPWVSSGEFSSQSAVCIPLPITRSTGENQLYTFGVIIVFNFILVLLVGIGQFFIYWSVRMNSISNITTTKRSKDMVIARRLISVALFDLLCWFPIGLLGLLASAGRPIPGAVNVPIVIFVLPLKSAMNPFLYTLNTIHERWRHVVEKHKFKRVLWEVISQDAHCSTDISSNEMKAFEEMKRSVHGLFY